MSLPSNLQFYVTKTKSNLRILIKECKSSKKRLKLFANGQHNTTWLSPNYTHHIHKFLSEVNSFRLFYLLCIVLLFFFSVQHHMRRYQRHLTLVK